MRYLTTYRIFESTSESVYNGIICVMDNNASVLYLFYIKNEDPYYKKCLETNSIDAIRYVNDTIAHFLNGRGYKFAAGGTPLPELSNKLRKGLGISGIYPIYCLYPDYGTIVDNIELGNDVIGEFNKFKSEHDYVKFDLIKVEKIDIGYEFDVIDRWVE